MYEDDRDQPEMDMAAGHGEPELRRHEWTCREKTVEVTLAELRQALAVLAVLDLDDDLEEAGEALWVH